MYFLFIRIKIDEEEWKSIKEQSEQKLKCLTEESDKFKNKLLLNKFDKNQKRVNCFKSIKVDPIFESFYRYITIMVIILKVILIIIKNGFKCFFRVENN